MGIIHYYLYTDVQVLSDLALQAGSMFFLTGPSFFYFFLKALFSFLIQGLLRLIFYVPSLQENDTFLQKA